MGQQQKGVIFYSNHNKIERWDVDGRRRQPEVSSMLWSAASAVIIWRVDGSNKGDIYSEHKMEGVVNVVSKRYLHLHVGCSEAAVLWRG